MKLVWTHRRFAWCIVLIGISTLTGCGGGGSTPPAASQAAAPPPSTPPSAPGDGAGTTAADPTAMASPPGDGYTPPADPSVTAGMPGEGYASDGYVPPGDGLSGGAVAGFGMPGFGMPGMGMPGMGMPGMGMPGGPGGMQAVDPAPADDADYMTKARYAFAIGKEAEAMQYFVAHVLSRETEAPGLLEQVRWSPAARKPALAARFAVGVDLKAPANIPDVKPIGRSQMAGNAPGGGSGDNAGMDMTSGPGGPGAPGGAGGGKTLGDLTGLFGETLVNTFESAWKNGDFGLAFKDIETIQPRPPRPNNAMGMPGMGMPGMDSGGGIPGAESGSGYDPGMVAGGGVPNPLAAPKDAALRLKAVAGKPVVPGLLFLGTGSVSELTSKAEKQGIDYMFVFEVTVKAQRNLIQNDTRLRLVPTSDKEGVTVASSVLNNLKVDRERMQKGETDDLDKQIGNVFRKVELLKMADLPKLTPAQAQARVKSLIDKKPADVLSTLMEIRLYNALGVLDNDERDAAYQLLLGGTGLAFVSGTVEDRESVLSPLLPAYK